MQTRFTHIIILLIILTLHNISIAQHTHFDTNYIFRFEKRNVAEIYPGISTTRFNFTSDRHLKSDFSLVANRSGNIGLYFGYKWVSFNYSWAIPGTALDKNVKLQSTSLGFTFKIKSWSIRPFYHSYNGLLIPMNPRTGNYRPVRDIEFTDAGVDVFYFFETKKFSLKAATSYSEKQVKRAGSLFLKFTPMWQKIKWEDPSRDVITDSTTYKLLTYNPEWFSLILRAGYTYNFSFRKGEWNIAPTVILGGGASREINTGINHLQLVTDIHASMTAGHSGHNFYYYLNLNLSKLQTNLFIKNLSKINAGCSITFGYRFKSLKKKIFGIL